MVFCVLIFAGGTGGVVMIEGESWREHRRFALHVFRDLGLGRNLMEERVSALSSVITFRGIFLDS